MGPHARPQVVRVHQRLQPSGALLPVQLEDHIPEVGPAEVPGIEHASAAVVRVAEELVDERAVGLELDETPWIVVGIDKPEVAGPIHGHGDNVLEVFRLPRAGLPSAKPPDAMEELAVRPEDPHDAVLLAVLIDIKSAVRPELQHPRVVEAGDEVLL